MSFQEGFLKDTFFLCIPSSREKLALKQKVTFSTEAALTFWATFHSQLDCLSFCPLQNQINASPKSPAPLGSYMLWAAVAGVKL